VRTLLLDAVAQAGGGGAASSAAGGGQVRVAGVCSGGKGEGGGVVGMARGSAHCEQLQGVYVIGSCKG